MLRKLQRIQNSERSSIMLLGNLQTEPGTGIKIGEVGCMRNDYMRRMKKAEGRRKRTRRSD